ncbi:MAG: FliH/SctL family protein, partial [Thermoguttaceae bacterium]|nr:FliH/SctL family protein [Thermoguttaceae bacterium]
IRAEAGRIVAKAHQEAAAIKKQAEAEGRRAGQAAVEQMVQNQLARQMATLLPALRQAVDEIRHAKQAWLTHWERSAIHVAAAIARRVIRRELTEHPEIAIDLVREALELAAGNTELRIHLHPADHQALGAQIESVVRELAPLASAELVADARVTPGGCRVETRFGVIDQQIETQLARIEEELA